MKKHTEKPVPSIRKNSAEKVRYDDVDNESTFSYISHNYLYSTDLNDETIHITDLRSTTFEIYCDQGRTPQAKTKN